MKPLTRKPTPARVPWSGRGLRYTDDEIAAVADAMRTADPLTQGPHQAAFEEKFRAVAGARHAFAVSSCTAALELAALLCRLGPGDEIVLPAHTFAATAIPFARTGARLVWADIDPDTRVVTAETIERCLTPRTKVVIVVHLYGLMCDMDPIIALARKRGLIVVEDAAQSCGATDKGRPAGSFGDFGCFSFHGHKNISTLGEGGMLTVQDDALAALVPGLRHNGMRPYPADRPLEWVPAATNVDFDIDGLWPYNFCLGEPQCALGARMLDRLDALNAHRRARAERFMAAFADDPELAFQATPEGRVHTWYAFAARFDGAPLGRSRDDFLTLLRRELGVMAGVMYLPLYRYPLFAKAGFGNADCPESDRFFDNMVAFPFQPFMPDDQFDDMIALVRRGLDRMRGRNA